MTADSHDVYKRLLTFTDRLTRAKIHHRFDQIRAEGISAPGCWDETRVPTD